MNTIKKINTILFDFDGTIMNTNELILRSWQHTFRMFTGSDGDADEILRSYGEPIDVTTARFFPERSIGEVENVYRAYHYDRYESAIELFPGILDLLENLKSQGYAMGVVTSRLYRTANIGMEKFGLFRYFDAFVTVNDTAQPKPDAAPIRLALSKLGRPAGRAVMIGDTRHDIQCARNAGVVPILVGWSLAVPPDERSGADAPDYILDKAADLPGILQELNA